MIKLIISDLDGTFLNSKGDFDRAYYQKIKSLMDAQGVAFSACTGKQCERVEELFGKDAKDIWILGDSATRIKHHGKYIYESLLENQLGKRIIRKLDEIADDHIIIACTPTAAFIKASVPEEIVQKMRMSYTVVETVENLQEIEEDFVKITVFDPKERAFEHVKHLEGVRDSAYIVASEAAWIDISNYNVHKGTTVMELQKILGVTSDETMAFGDGLNDIELMEAAEYSFCMSNGFEQTKEAATFVTKSNDQNGVLSTIEKILALQNSK